VATNPLWVALATLLLFRERLSGATWLGLALTVGGATLIALSDGRGENGANALFGNMLALLGAVAGSAYFLIGRTLRRRLSTLAYIWLVYSVAAFVLLAVALAVGWGGGHGGAALQGLGGGDGRVGQGGAALLGIPVMGYVLMLGLAIGPQLLGHTSFNWALRYLSATFVALAILGEPIGSALLALIFFNESFEPLQLVGFLLLLVGIAVAARAEE
jgi:drug/metabolite transporter (DMT)-like permease